MKNIIFIPLILIGCGGSDFSVASIEVPDDIHNDSGVGGSSAGGFIGSSGQMNSGGIASFGGNSSGGLHNDSGGAFTQNGGNPPINTGGAPEADSGQGNGGSGCDPKTCADIAVELGADKACGNVDNGCGHFMDCGNDCAKGGYDPYYAKCGAANSVVWQGGSPVFFPNKNLCGVNCAPGINGSFVDGRVGPCESIDGHPYNSALPIEVNCKFDIDFQSPIPYPGCELKLKGNIGIGSPSVFCCDK